MFQFLSGDLNARNPRGSPSYPQIAPPLKPHSPPKPVQNESNKTPSSSTSIRTQNQNPETPRNPVSAREQNRTTSATRNGPEESQTNHKTAEPEKKKSESARTRPPVPAEPLGNQQQQGRFRQAARLQRALETPQIGWEKLTSRRRGMLDSIIVCASRLGFTALRALVP